MSKIKYSEFMKGQIISDLWMDETDMEIADMYDYDNYERPIFWTYLKGRFRHVRQIQIGN